MNVTRLHITVALLLAAVVWAGVLLLQGIPVSMEQAAPFGTVVTFLGLMALAIEHVLWRRRWLHGWMFCRPDLRGTWTVELQSSYVDPATGKRIAPIVCYAGVTQTLSKLQIHLMTPESESWLIAHSISKSQNEDGFQVFGLYTNKPGVLLRANRSEMHIGALVLDTHGLSNIRPETMTAEYFTDRLTRGSILFSGRINEHKTRFIDAAAAISGATL